MDSLVIDLQDGFADDTVVIRVEGKEIYHKQDVNTNHALGHADSVETQVDQSSISIEIIVLSRFLRDILALDVCGTMYLGVSILDDKIDYRISKEMFYYF
jgi:hypothetical protein